MVKKLHIDNWIAKAEPDYYTMFIKAWIPFNAWYFTTYSTKRDSDALEKIYTTSNKIKNRIIAMLKKNDFESMVFKKHIATLHTELVNRTVLNYEKPVSFSEIILTGYFPNAATDTKDNIIYKAIPHKTNGYRAVVVAADGSKTYMDKAFSPYSINDFELNNHYLALNKKSQKIIKRIFLEIDPNKPKDLIAKKGNKSSSIIMDKEKKIYFINEPDLIANALINILYTLRCLLIHGELDPTDINIEIYKRAYYIINPIIQEIK
ncbi:MAG: hypothetical protein RJA07_460 [Bacteroidota bacterium]|jgi:hypothetical protein